VLGFVISGILFPKYLSTTEIGVLGLIVSYSLIIAQVCSLGFGGVTVKFLPQFKSPTGTYNGYPRLVVLALMAGAVVVILAYLILVYAFPNLIRNNTSDFESYQIWIVPFSIVILWFIILDSYNRALLNASFGSFLKEFIQRLFILFFLILFVFYPLSFERFIWLYLLAFFIPTLTILLLLWFRNHLNLREKLVMPEPFRKEATGVGLVGLIAGLSSLVVLNIDRIMINQMVGTAETGIYVITSYFGVLVSMPSRGFNRIATAVIATSFQKDDLHTIREIYNKGSLFQYILGLLLLLLLAGNTQGIFDFLPEEYQMGKNVIYFIGLANLVIMVGSVNRSIIAVSRFYAYQAYFTVALVLLTIITNWLLIPLYGINGAALASLLSTFVFNVMRWRLLYVKFGFQPYGMPHFKATVVALGIYFILGIMPYLHHFIVDIAVRSLLITITFLPTLYFLKISTQFNNQVDQFFTKIGSILKK
jgi:O-antigen/teichoic acid export membrane protein